MSILRRRRPLDIWPAFVDAIASLLMIVIFVVLIAAVGQLFLSGAILGRDDALARLNERVSDLADLLSMQQAETSRLNELVALRTASLEAAETRADEGDETIAAQADVLEQRAGIIAEQQAALADGARRLAALENDVAALEALRTRLESELESTLAERADVRAKLAEEAELNVARLAQIEHLNRQLAEVRKQLAALAHALEVAEADAALKQTQIADLGERLNLALASKAAELQRYRSEFFGRLRDALADYPGIEIVGDRFVLPSGVLFASGEATLGADGRRQVRRLAETIRDLTARIPPDLDWVLRIDGHTDRRPIATERFPSNWELSAARAISIVRELTRAGVPAARLAATGFAEHHPIDTGETPAALARNRRIEIKLTRP